jgi:hydrogenase expression/formation protein HypC
MCLAVPGRVTKIGDEFATVDIEGIKIQACIGLVGEVKVGDFVIVHAGFAISKLDLEEAEDILKLFRQFDSERS